MGKLGLVSIIDEVRWVDESSIAIGSLSMYETGTEEVKESSILKQHNDGPEIRGVTEDIYL